MNYKLGISDFLFPIIQQSNNPTIIKIVHLHR